MSAKTSQIWFVFVGLSAGGKSLVAWRESDDQPQCGGDVHAFHHERGGGAAAMPCEHDGQAGDEADADDGEEDAAARVVRSIFLSILNVLARMPVGWMRLVEKPCCS